jgi:hypothetical protein
MTERFPVGQLTPQEVIEETARRVEEFHQTGVSRREECLALTTDGAVQRLINQQWDAAEAEAKADEAKFAAEKARLAQEKAAREQKVNQTPPVVVPMRRPKSDAELLEEARPKLTLVVPEGRKATTQEIVQNIVTEPEPVWLPDEIKQLNSQHAVISNVGGKCVVMEWVRSHIMPGTFEISYQSFTSFRERYSNQYIESLDGRGRTEYSPLAPAWLSHPARRQYEGLDLVPNGPKVLSGNMLNLWRGFGVQPKKGSWRLLRRHIGEVLANGNAEFEEFILRSTAWKFQNPGLPPEVVLALLGGKGAGKGAWGYVQMLIWGTHGLQIFSPTHLYGKHNAHLQNKLFLFLDEAMWAGDKEAERVLKGLTTEKWMMIEPKGINAFPWPNRLGIMMSGNAKWLVPASHDERRYATNRISEKYKQDKGYFVPLFEEIDGGGAAAMLHDLLQLDLDGWHPRENVPQTATLIEQKMLGLEGLEQWYVHLLDVAELPKASMKALLMPSNPRWVASETLLKDAMSYSPRNKYVNDTELGRFMGEMGCLRKSNGRKWGWVFPPLGEARSAWLIHVGGNWEWLVPEIADWGEKPVEEET